MKMKKNRRNVLKPSRLVFLIVLVAANTFAWFIYATKIDSTVSVHVRAWDVVFEAEENEISNIVNINVGDIYPGMEDYEYSIKAYNRSEVDATLTYQVLSANILGTQYMTPEYRQSLGQQPNANDLTSAQLEAKLLNDYPFTISFSTSSNVIELGDGEETYTLSTVWPFESNHDDIDTLWGVNASNFKKSHPSDPSISIIVKITITQSTNQNGS